MLQIAKSAIALIAISFFSCSALPHSGARFEHRAKSEAMKDKYRPVVLIHGLESTKHSLSNLTEFIKKNHPGTEVYNIPILLDGQSLWFSMWGQVDLFYEVIQPIMQKAKNGINLIGHSQGGLIARGLLEAHDHNVHNFISLSSPQAGQYGGDEYLKIVNMTTQDAYKWFYKGMYQLFSVPNYWNDPHHQALYKKNCLFLPILNNVKEGSYKPEYKKNFLKLNKLVLVGGPDDEVITPWQSSYFSYFDENENVVDFRQREIYTKDRFGLKTLDSLKKLKIYKIPNVKHTEWHENQKVLRHVVLPWLD